MANQRGQSGFVALHGYLFPGIPVVNGAVLATETTLDVTVAGGSALYGVVAPGDTFTVAGVSGTYTVTGQPLVAQASAVTGVTFTPEAPVGGFPDGAALTFATPLVAQVRTWNLETTLTALDSTCMQDPWRTYVPGIANWTARLGLLLDYGDSEQAAIIDAVNAGIPLGLLTAVMLGATDTAGMDLATFRPHVLCEPGEVTSVEVVGALDDLVAVVVQCTRSQGWAPVVVPPPPVALLDGLVAHWTLDEASGTRADSTANGLDLTDNGSVGQAAGLLGDAATFDASLEQYLSRAGGSSTLLSFGNTSFTIACWVQVSDLLATYLLVAKGVALPSTETMEYQLAFNFSTGQWQFLVGNGTTSATTESEVAPVVDTWTLLVGRHNHVDDTITLTVNASSNNPVTAGYSGGSYSSGEDFALGRYGGTDGGHLNGMLDAVSIWDRALTDDEVDALYNGGAGLDYPFS